VSHRKRTRKSNDVGPGMAHESPNRLASSPLPANHLTSGEVNVPQQFEAVTPPPNLPSCVGGIMTSDSEEREGENEEDMSLAHRRPRHQNRQMPKRFRDVLPVPPPTMSAEVRKLPPASVSEVIMSNESSALPLHSVFRMTPNIFGPIRQYFSSIPPSHDPEEYVTMTDLSFIPGSSPANEVPNLPTASGSNSQYHPYPN
jgi:hypothetical protein